ncbi:MFS transporter [Gulosibacter molinativorax]|uniref:MFS transporter n=1 Tax=Gulosibacter molinativorax TaxID=256821 RepID=A0ABT7CBQ1_9MICO|nr:MFS transporter [Gulosibacter molinativorax]MDJ1372623.1 MFS transporter [Gulosibacter molinativorax]QUY62593.1 Gentisate transporter [Gulosibacter molinativorax]
MNTTFTQVSTPAPGTTPRKTPQWIIVAICIAVTVVEGYNLIVYGSVVPALIADPGMNVTNESAGLAGSAVYVGMLIGATTSGVLGDRYGRQRTLIVVMIVFLIGAICTGLSFDAWSLGAARLFSGLGIGGAVTTALAISRSQATARNAGVIVTITMAGIPIGGTIAALAGIPMIPAFGWRPMFFLGAALTLVILLFVVSFRMEDRSAIASAESRGSRPGLAQLFRGRGWVIALVVALAAIPNMFTWYGLNTWLVSVMGELNYSLTNALLFSFTLTGGAVLGSFLTMRWADIWGIPKVGAVMATLTVIGLIGIATGPKDLFFSLVCVALMGAGGHSTMNLINAATSNLFPAELRATALGWSNGSSYVGAILGPTAGGLVLDSAFGANGVFVLYGISAACAAIAMVALVGVSRPQEAAMKTVEADA